MVCTMGLLAALLLSACSSPLQPRLTNAPPRPVAVSRVLPIPDSGQVQAAPGDTVYAIARRYGVAVRELIEVNQLLPPYTLTIGRALRLPPPADHVVRQGDTIYSISRRYQVDMSALVRLNRLLPPYQIRAGKVLRIPGRTGVRTVQPIATTTSAPPGSSSGVGAPPLPQPRPVAGQLVSPSKPRVAKSQPTKPRSVRLASPPARSGRKFLWPVRGRMISGFGPRKGGLHNDGINIAAPRGTTILAAENGIVAYAGDELRAFGNLLLIKHQGGWTTAYAHASRLLVERGQTVKRGQAIATIGSTGSVDRPQLHFELRRGARAINPRGRLDG